MQVSLPLHRVQMDRQFWSLTLIASLIFLWPLIAYGRAGYIQDSASYYKGGRVAVSFLLNKAHIGPASENGGSSDMPQRTDAKPGVPDGSDVKGARSVPYSVAAYILGAPNAKMLFLCVFQSLLTGFLCALTFNLFDRKRSSQWRRVAILAVVTPVAFVVCVAIPDIFSALIILSLTLLATVYERLSWGAVIVCVFIAALGVTFHASDLPIALAITVLAVGWLSWQAWRKTPVSTAQWAAVIAPMFLGVMLTILSNAVAFGGASLTGKRYPLTLARSIAEGPGKWYLDKNCPHLKLAVCELYPNGVPSTIPAFLWDKNGLKERASSEQMDRIRAEESEIVLAATLAYPWQEVERIGSNVARQLVRFEVGRGVLDNRIVLDGENQPVLETVPYNHLWTRGVFLLTIISVALSLIVLARSFIADHRTRPMIAFVGAGIVVNAFVCVYFSGLADRYNARTIWLLPLLALAFYQKRQAAEVSSV